VAGQPAGPKHFHCSQPENEIIVELVYNPGSEIIPVGWNALLRLFDSNLGPKADASATRFAAATTR